MARVNGSGRWCGTMVCVFFLLGLSACKGASRSEPVPQTTPGRVPSAPEKSETQTGSPQETQAYLGILYVNTLDGVMILEVFPDSPASKAGLRPYDLIISANGYPIIGSYTLKERILSLNPGTAVEIEIRNRDGIHSLRHAILEPMPERFRKKVQGATF